MLISECLMLPFRVFTVVLSTYLFLGLWTVGHLLALSLCVCSYVCWVCKLHFPRVVLYFFSFSYTTNGYCCRVVCFPVSPSVYSKNPCISPSPTVFILQPFMLLANWHCVKHPDTAQTLNSPCFQLNCQLRPLRGTLRSSNSRPQRTAFAGKLLEPVTDSIDRDCGVLAIWLGFPSIETLHQDQSGLLHPLFRAVVGSVSWRGQPPDQCERGQPSGQCKWRGQPPVSVSGEDNHQSVWVERTTTGSL